jgi:Na+/H+-translocating membrane pyrophosphatase
MAIIVCIDNFKFYTAFAFLLGALTSTISGYIGMYVATITNVRVTYMAAYNIYRKGEEKQKMRDALSEAFKVAFKGGCVMGFCLVSLALLVLTVIIMVYSSKFNIFI